MKFRAILHNAKNGNTTIESIDFDTEAEAIDAGEAGLNLYGGSDYSIAQVDEASGHIISQEKDE